MDVLHERTVRVEEPDGLGEVRGDVEGVVGKQEHRVLGARQTRTAFAVHLPKDTRAGSTRIEDSRGRRAALEEVANAAAGAAEQSSCAHRDARPKVWSALHASQLEKLFPEGVNALAAAMHGRFYAALQADANVEASTRRSGSMPRRSETGGRRSFGKRQTARQGGTSKGRRRCGELRCSSGAWRVTMRKTGRVQRYAARRPLAARVPGKARRDVPPQREAAAMTATAERSTRTTKTGMAVATVMANTPTAGRATGTIRSPAGRSGTRAKTSRMCPGLRAAGASSTPSGC
ncbi:MAG: hypothetical protein KatS3mg102_0003 [Planctomycetota bacterium]|nr:MAG: hypothetical protein KatS3mg102_0003 [Planctomycetota bacterium]